MTSAENKSGLVRVAAIVAIVGNACLAGLKLTFGTLAQSRSLVADGFDSLADVLISVIALVIIAVIAKPADKEHPWGHRRAETIATAFLSFAIFFVGTQLIVDGIRELVSGGDVMPSVEAVIVAGVSVVGKAGLAFSQFVLGRRAKSAIIRANAVNMASDAIVSVGVLVGLGISAVTQSSVADKVIAILIGAWIIKTAFGIFKESNLELMDGSANVQAYQIIASAVDSVEGASNPHRARMRRIAGFWDISFDINVDPNCTVSEGHAIATQVEEYIRQRLVVFDIMVHIEPHGEHAPEAFGLSEDDMRA